MKFKLLVGELFLQRTGSMGYWRLNDHYLHKVMVEKMKMTRNLTMTVTGRLESRIAKWHGPQIMCFTEKR